MDIKQEHLDPATSEEQNNFDQQACKRALSVLFKHYPGHSWYVTVEGGVMNIRSMNLSSNWGFRELMSNLGPSPEEFDMPIMRAGGEILERFGLAASSLDLKVYQELPRDLRGIPMKDTG